MKLKCPECQTRYQIDDTKIPEKGAKFQCKKCQKQFRLKKRSKQSINPESIQMKTHSSIPKEPLKETEKYGYEMKDQSVASSPQSDIVKKDEELSKEKNDGTGDTSSPYFDETNLDTGSQQHLPATTQTGSKSFEKILNFNIPDYSLLLRSAEEAKKNKTPDALVHWDERPAICTKRGLKEGIRYDVFKIDEGLCLFRHPTLLEKLFGWLFELINAMMTPIHNLKMKMESLLIDLSNKLGFAFTLVSIPLSIIACMADMIFFCIAYVRSLLTLITQPIVLVREIIFLPFRLLFMIISRILKTLLLACFSKYLKPEANLLETLIKRFPWIRGLILGFLRKDIPVYPVLIPKESVRQVFLTKRRRLFKSQLFLIIVEGDAINRSFSAWFSYKLKSIFLPFYWERTIHMLRLYSKDKDAVSKDLSEAVEKDVEIW